MKTKMKKIDNISAGIYKGYLWKSDEQKPKVYNNESLDTLLLNNCENPFIIEGQLYDEKSQKSYSIRYIDGEYWAYEYDLNELKMDFTEHLYIASFENAQGKLNFRQYWREKKDNLCEDMMILYPAEFVFVGFK